MTLHIDLLMGLAVGRESPMSPTLLEPLGAGKIQEGAEAEPWAAESEGWQRLRACSWILALPLGKDREENPPLGLWGRML